MEMIVMAPASHLNWLINVSQSQNIKSFRFLNSLELKKNNLLKAENLSEISKSLKD